MLGGNVDHLTRVELRKRGVEPDSEHFEEKYEELKPEIEAQVEQDAEAVREAGGLFICGTERHESRRIDNQLRGRSGRQGDPGESRFYLSAEDDLVRLFSGERMYKMLERFDKTLTDDEGNELPIEAKMITKRVAGAQKWVEEQNFLIRKRVLEYDDVLNKQREVVYQYRDEILQGRDMSETIKEQLEGVFERLVAEYTQGDYVEDWDIDEHVRAGQADLPVQLRRRRHRARVDHQGGADRAHPRGRAARLRRARAGAWLGPAAQPRARRAACRSSTTRWQEHLLDMDYLREGIHLRSFAQKDPLVEYKNEGFNLFGELMNSIWEDFGRYIFHVEVEVAPSEAEMAFAPSSRSSSTGSFNYSGGGPNQPSALQEAAAQGGVQTAEMDPDIGEPGTMPEVETRHVDERDKIGRNDPCWCGSGKKFKKCHGA